jgi:nucleoside-triphosphatase THEP1
VIIVTGAIDSGKTSWCRELVAANPAIRGVLLLKVYRQGHRIGYDAWRVPEGARLPFARTEGHEPPGWDTAERIGPFSISRAGLQNANSWLSEAAAASRTAPASGSRAVIVDEIGPLELAGGGLSPGLGTLLASAIQMTLYIVVRRDSVEAVCDRFGISGYTLVEVEPENGSGLKGR